MKGIIILFFVFLNISVIASNESDTIFRVFELGEVSISGGNNPEPVLSLSRDEILKQGHNNLAESLAGLPGLSLHTSGSRNEASVFMRGFDSRQIALLVDGIPVYISYDGNIDLARFLSWNYEKISVSQGFTSLLYGPNTMGGAINLITSKPAKAFEIDLYSGIMMGREGYNGLMENLRLGGKKGRFFYQGGISYHDQNSWSLTKSYQEDKNLIEGKRDNSYEKDLNGNLRLGYVTERDNEYVLSFNKQNGDKGIPVYEGEIQSARYWQMPKWNKESLYFNSKTGIGENSSIISRIYIDKFYNLLESYDDSTYSSQTFRYAFSSIYDDKSLGANILFKTSVINKSAFSLAAHIKRDVHSEQNGVDLPFLNFSDNIFSLAIEDAYRISEKLNLIGGLSWNLKSNTGAEEYFSNEDSLANMMSASDKALNYRMGVFFNPSSNNKFWINYSSNSRFATMKERYSYRLGRSMPNPDLGSEKANHFIVGYRFNTKNFSIHSEIFHINSSDKIAYTNIDPDVVQYQNIDKSVSYGADLQLILKLNMGHSFIMNYSYLNMENPDDKEFFFIDIPEHSMGLSSNFKINDNIEFNLRYNFLSGHFSYTDGSFSTDGYGLLNAGINIDFRHSLSLQFSVNNFPDKAYYYTEGYPAEGSNARLGIRYTFK